MISSSPPSSHSSSHSSSKLVIYLAVTRWWRVRASTRLLATLPFLKSWGNYTDNSFIDPSHSYTIDSFCTFKSQRHCHLWVEVAIQSPESESAVDMFLSAILNYKHPPSFNKIFLIAYNFSHHKKLIGISDKLFVLACKLGQSFQDIIANPSNRLLQLSLCFDLNRFHHCFSRWKHHDFYRITNSLANMVATGISKYLVIFSEISHGKLSSLVGGRLLAVYDSYQLNHFSQLERLMGTHAAKALVLTTISSRQLVTSLVSVMKESTIKRLDDVFLKSVLDENLLTGFQNNLLHTPNNTLTLDLLKKSLVGSQSALRLLSFQSTIDPSFRVPYPWSRTAHFDTEAYLTPDRRVIGLIKRQIIAAHNSVDTKHASQLPNFVPNFVPNVVKYLYDTLTVLLYMNPKNTNRDFDTLSIDSTFISQQCKNGTFDGRKYFGHYFHVLESELSLQRSNRSEKFCVSKAAVYAAFDRFEFPFDGLISLIELLEFVRTDYINQHLRSRQTNCNFACQLEQSCFLEDLLTQKTQLPVLNRWAGKAFASRSLASRHEFDMALSTRFARFMTSFGLTNKGQIQLEDMPEICLLTRQLTVEYKLQLRDIAVSSAIFHYVLHVLGLPGIKLINAGQLKKVVYLSVGNDTKSIKHESQYICKILQVIANFLLDPGDPSTAKHGPQLYKLIGPSGLLYPEYSVKEVEGVKQAAGCDLEEDEDVYWSVDAKHYGVVTSNQIQSLNPLLVLKNPRKWLLDKVTQIVKSPNTEYLSKACYDWLEKKLTKEVVKATAGAGNAVQPDGDTDMEDVSRNPVPAAQRVHLFEEEADFMVTRIMRLWHYICVTYDPVLEALWKSWKQQQPSNDDKEYKNNNKDTGKCKDPYVCNYDRGG